MLRTKSPGQTGLTGELSCVIAWGVQVSSLPGSGPGDQFGQVKGIYQVGGQITQHDATGPGTGIGPGQARLLGGKMGRGQSIGQIIHKGAFAAAGRAG